MTDKCAVAVVGAGPYGLSVAAHLRHRGVDVRILGTPMNTWRTAMPKGMRLKSDGFASSLSAPEPGSSLGDYCRERALPYHDTDIPVPLETFVNYGLDFQRRFVPDVDEHPVVLLARNGRSFRLGLGNGRELDARHVVVAVGITHFAVTPDVFRPLPAESVTHSSNHHELDDFAGRDVTVIGAGSSAVEVAVALAIAGAQARLVARSDSVRFGSAPVNPRKLADRIRRPQSGLGPGWASWLSCNASDLFRFAPARWRPTIVRRHLGPLSPWHLRAPFESSVELVTSHAVKRADAVNGRVALTLKDTASGSTTTVETDHVICATGYRADVSRLTFIDPAVSVDLKTLSRYPVLSHGFESSVSGLSFVGLAAAVSFGPLMRFMYGDEFAARRITARLARSRR